MLSTSFQAPASNFVDCAQEWSLPQDIPGKQPTARSSHRVAALPSADGRGGRLILHGGAASESDPERLQDVGELRVCTVRQNTRLPPQLSWSGEVQEDVMHVDMSLFGKECACHRSGATVR